MYSFARKPIWLAGHALAGSLLVIFVIAGFWQLSRHGQQLDRNRTTLERLESTPLDADQFLEAVSDAELHAGLEYRSVNLPVDRIYWREVVQISNRQHLGGSPGCHLAVPVAINSDSTTPIGVLIIAGWLPQDDCDTALAEGGIRRTAWYRAELDAAAHIRGYIRPSQERGWLQPAYPANEVLRTIARVDVERIDQQTTLDLVPVYVELTYAWNWYRSRIGPRPPVGGETPWFFPLGEPTPRSVPHLGYALQWFSFAAVAIVGYTLVLRRQARKGDAEQIADD